MSVFGRKSFFHTEIQGSKLSHLCLCHFQHVAPTFLAEGKKDLPPLPSLTHWLTFYWWECGYTLMQEHLGNVVPGWTALPGKHYPEKEKHGGKHLTISATPSKLPNDEISCFERYWTLMFLGAFKRGPTSHVSSCLYEDSCTNLEGRLPASVIALSEVFLGARF